MNRPNGAFGNGKPKSFPEGYYERAEAAHQLGLAKFQLLITGSISEPTAHRLGVLAQHPLLKDEPWAIAINSALTPEPTHEPDPATDQTAPDPQA